MKCLKIKYESKCLTMLILIFFFFTILLLSGCTVSFSVVGANGKSSDLLDEEQSTDADFTPTIPLNF